jgi:DsbC/DsbD-like thiol-disulfide interchange protein
LRRLMLAVVLCASVLAIAEENTPQSFGRPALVTLAPLQAITILPGHTAKVTIRFNIADGYHVNSNKPNSDLLIPTAVKITSPAGFTVGKISYPAGQDFALKFAPEEKLNVYAGEVSVSASVRAAKILKAGNYRLTGELQYQACNDISCFPPKKLPLEISVNVR